SVRGLCQERGFHPDVHFSRRYPYSRKRVSLAGRGTRTSLDGQGGIRPRLCRNPEGMAGKLRPGAWRRTAARRVRRALRAALALLSDVLRRRLSGPRYYGGAGDSGETRPKLNVIA